MLVWSHDINKDGWTDLILLKTFLSALTYFSNSPSGWRHENPIALGDAGAIWIDICDIDGDGAVDMVVAAYRDDGVGWHRQLGLSLQFGSREDVGSILGASSVSCRDVNADGHMDVVATGMDSDAVVWCVYQFITDTDTEKV